MFDYYHHERAHFPYWFEYFGSATPKRDEILAWCEERFGRQSGDRWYYHVGVVTFKFMHRDDAFEFRMRWC